MKLMIVEDNSKMRDLLKTLFKKNFDEIVECEDGKDASSVYKRSKPDWVFMDLKLNEVDGIIATTEIRQSFPDAKILIVTDFGDEHLRQKANAAGAIGYVLKENLQEIFRIIR